MSTDLIKHTTTSTVLIDDVEIPVEVATDPVKGLSGRDDLAVNTGMLFDLDGHPVITMRGMKFALDIIWISEDKKVVDISRNTLISVLGNDTLYSPEKPAKYALEINAGEAQKRGIKVDDEVEINLLPNSDLTRLLVLEEVLDYLVKAVPGEKLEYLKPGEQAPRGIQVQRGARGGRGYYPSEVTAVEEETAVLEEGPTEEQEIDVVQAEPLDDVVSFDDSPAELDENNYADHGKEFAAYLLQNHMGSFRIEELLYETGMHGGDLEPFYEALVEYVDNTPWPVPVGSNRPGTYDELGLKIVNTVYSAHGPTHPLVRRIIDDFLTEKGGEKYVQEMWNARIPNTRSLDALMRIAPASLLQEWANKIDGDSIGHLSSAVPPLIGNSFSAFEIIKTRLSAQKYIPDKIGDHFSKQIIKLTVGSVGLPKEEKLLPPLDEWPEDFQKLFENITTIHNPSTQIVKIMDELYKSTKFGIFHEFSKEAWEQGASTPYAGILKEAASRVLDGPIVFHNIDVGWRDANASVIHEEIQDAYATFDNRGHPLSNDFVDSYMKVQKQLTFELLNMAFPDVEDFELFRGVDDPNLYNVIDESVADEAEDMYDEEADEWVSTSEKRRILAEPHDPEAPIPEFDEFFSNVTHQFYENPISSWSLDYKAAATQFAEGRDNGVVLRRKVNKGDVWASFLTHAYNGNEYEMIVIPNKNHFTVGAVFEGGDYALGLERGHDKAKIYAEGANYPDLPPVKDVANFEKNEGLKTRGVVVSDIFNPQTREGFDYRSFLQRIEWDEKSAKIAAQRKLGQKITKANEDEAEDEEKKPKKIVIEDNGNEDWIKEVRKKIEETKTDDNLSKLLALSTGLEYLSKQEPGKREYLAPGEEAPEGVRVERGQRGGRYYTPLVHSSDIDRALGIDPEIPEEEREIDVVAPSEPEEQAAPSEQSDMLTPNGVNEYFDTIATNLEDQLIKIAGEGHKPFLGKEISPSNVTADNITTAGYTDGSEKGDKYPSGMGIHSYENFTVTLASGFLGRHKKPFIYKMVPGENRGEILAYSIDRVLGLNIVPFVKQHSINMGMLNNALEQTHGTDIGDNSFQDMRQKGVDTRAAGHFQEFCENCVGIK